MEFVGPLVAYLLLLNEVGEDVLFNFRFDECYSLFLEDLVDLLIMCVLHHFITNQ